MNCPKCGATVASSFAFCENCGCKLERQQPAYEQPVYQQPAYEQPVYQQPVQEKKRENVVTGTVGALIGAVIGAAAIILVSRLGYVAGFCGLILAVCTLKGYELLGGKLSAKGIIIGVILMLVTPYLADRIDWALLVLEEFSDYGISFAEAFAAIPELIEEEAIEASDYYTNLAMLYGFTLLGGFSTVIGAIKKK